MERIEAESFMLCLIDEQQNTFLVDIGCDSNGKHVLSFVEDKVVQDVDGSEGTGTWSQNEAVRLHVPAPKF